MQKRRPQLLLVDDEPNMLEMLRRMLSQEAENWDAHFCGSVDEAMAVLEESEIDTVVTDVRMPGRDGFDLLQTVRRSENTRHVPVIILTGDGDRSLKRRALDLGATDLLSKPTDREDLLARIRSALRIKDYEDLLAGRVETLDSLVSERTKQLEAARREIVLRLAKACEYRDDDTGNHVVRVACYSFILGKTLGMDGDALDLLYLTSPLHDVGKIGIADKVLLKPGKLTPEERAEIERHPAIGAEILSHQPKAVATGEVEGMVPLISILGEEKVPLLDMASDIAEHHHEKWNGQGYPEGLSGERISVEARIVAVADVYDALRSERPYKSAFSEEKAFAIIQEECGTHFDPAVVEAFTRRYSDIQAVNAQFADGEGPGGTDAK